MAVNTLTPTQRANIEREIVAREKEIADFSQASRAQLEAGDKQAHTCVVMLRAKVEALREQVGIATGTAALVPADVEGASEMLLADVDRLTREFSDEAIQRAVADAMAAVKQQKGALLELLDPKDAQAALDRAGQKRLTEQTRARQELARSVLSRAPRITKAIEEAIASSRLLPVPRPSDPQAAAITRTAELLECQELRLRFDGRPLHEVVRLYTATADEANPALISFLEDEWSAGFPTLKPLQDKDDRDQASTFQRAIRERQERRVPVRLTDLQQRVNDLLGKDSELGTLRKITLLHMADRDPNRGALDPSGGSPAA